MNMSRVMSSRTVNAMVAADTYQDLATRVANLFGHHRRIALATGHVYPDGTRCGGTPQLLPGLTLARPVELWNRPDGARGITIVLQPDILSLGFSAGADTPDEAAQWERHTASDLPGLTQIKITGGMPGDGPARDDSLTIRQWNERGTCRETIIGFDYGTGPCNLAALLPELDQYLAQHRAPNAAALPASKILQLGADRAMLERVQELLHEHLAHALHPAPAPACTLIPAAAEVNQ